jgi:hypothetical protein
VQFDHATATRHLPPQQIHRQVMRFQRRHRRCRVGASCEGIQARHEFDERKGFGEIVVGARVQPLDTVFDPAKCREHEDRCLDTIPPGRTYHRQPVQAWDHPVDYRDISLPGRQFGQRFEAIADPQHMVAQFLQATQDMLTDYPIVFEENYLHCLERMQDAGAADPGSIDDAIAQTRGLLETFHALLRIGSVEGGVGRRHFKRFDLSELMDRVQQAYEPAAEDAGHSLVADHVSGIMAESDSELLAQLFTNLIENAIGHTPPGTVITSRLALVDGCPTAEICDDGPGVPEDERTKIFQRFYRLDASRHSEGAGLGLALVAAIAALHRARYVVPPADGLCVRIIFPASPSE